MAIASDDAGDGTTLGVLLLVDDDAVFLRILGRALTRHGFEIRTAGSLEGAFAQLSAAGPPVDFALLDLNLAGVSSLKLVGPILRANPDCRIVILTGYASVASAVDAMKLGVAQYLAKPAEVETIVKALLGDESPDVEALPIEILSVQRLEWEHIQRVLSECGGNISAAARALKMHRRTLQRKLAKRLDGAAGGT